MSKNTKTRKAKKISVNILFCILLGMIAILPGLSIYSRVVYRNTIKHAFDLTRHARLTIYNSMEVISYANRIMDIYHGLSDEQRALIGTPAYKEFFKSIDTARGSVYSRLNNLLGSFQISDEISDLYLAFYDDETDALVYPVDPAEDNKFFPGEWKPVESREVDKFINWDGRGNDKFFGMDRLVKALRAGEDKAPDIIINTVKKALDGFVRSTDPFDDITMMCLEYKGSK